MDMNDRALREVVTSLGGVRNGYPREGGFDITVASEVMAILCLADDLADLERRLGDIIIGYTRDRRPVHARDLKADGAMAVLLAQAILPNLVQTLENNPAFVHGGPFANIAHGCNSVVATRTALRLADFVVTEAGFGADLGAEKFLNIKCRKAGLHPDAAVIVATVRALKMNGGVGRDALGQENVAAVRKGCANLGRHIANIRSFGVPAVVAINHFEGDSEAEVAAVKAFVAEHGTEAILCRHWAEGSKGITELATRVAKIADSGAAQFDVLYPDEMPLFRKIETIARRIYGADEVLADTRIRDATARLGEGGLRPPAGLHGQDAVLLLDRPGPARRADRLRGAGARGAPRRRRRLHRGDLRRDHDDAGAAAAAFGGGDPLRRRGTDRRAVLRLRPPAAGAKRAANSDREQADGRRSH